MRTVDDLFKAPLEVRVLRTGDTIFKDSPLWDRMQSKIINAGSPQEQRRVDHDIVVKDFRFLQFVGIGGEDAQVMAVIMHKDGEVRTTAADNLRFLDQ